MFILNSDSGRTVAKKFTLEYGGGGLSGYGGGGSASTKTTLWAGIMNLTDIIKLKTAQLPFSIRILMSTLKIFFGTPKIHLRSVEFALLMRRGTPRVELFHQRM